MIIKIPLKTILRNALCATWLLLWHSDLFAVDTKRLSSDAPILSVDETSYGTKAIGDHKEIIEKLNVKITDLGLDTSKNKEKDYQIQCFFFKREHAASPLNVYDVVFFDVPDMRKKYSIEATNIALPKAPSRPKAKSKSKPKPAPTPNLSQLPCLGGYCINVLYNNKLLSQSYSSAEIRQLVEANSSILNPKLGRKVQNNSSLGF